MLGRKVSYVRCINCSYNNVAKGIHLLDKKHFCLYMKNVMQVRAFERYNSLISPRPTPVYRGTPDKTGTESEA